MRTRRRSWRDSVLIPLVRPSTFRAGLMNAVAPRFEHRLFSELYCFLRHKAFENLVCQLTGWNAVHIYHHDQGCI